jgi:DHA1 family bicyclomycin/chloramphenicol resistance-like MFS transporter
LLAIVLVFYNVLFPNLNAATMIPVGHVAGTAAAVYATVTTAAGAVVGERLDKAFDGTVNPFSLSFAIAGLVALGLVLAVGHAGSREVR